MNELDENEKIKISTNNKMEVSNYFRARIRKYFELTPKQVRDFKTENELDTLDEAYQSLKILMDEELGKKTLTAEQKKAQKKEANRLRNIVYRERKKAKANLNKLMLDLPSFKSFNIDLTKKGLNNNFKEVINILNTNTTRDILLRLSSGTFGQPPVYFTYNERARGIFNQLLEGAMFSEIVDSNESDEELNEVIRMYKTLTVSLSAKKQEGQSNANESGAFFKYFHKLQYDDGSFVDLSRYGIYYKGQKIECKEQCFIYALRMAGVEEEKVNICKNKVITRQLPKKYINELAEAIGYYISVVVFGAKDKAHYGDKALMNTEKHIDLVLIDGHYLINDKRDCEEMPSLTAFGIKNYHTLKEKGIKKWWCRKTEKKTEKLGCANMSKVVQALLVNKENVLEEIPKKDLYSTQFYDQAKTIGSLDYDPIDVAPFGEGKKLRKALLKARAKQQKAKTKKENKKKEAEENAKKDKPKNSKYVFFDFETNTRHSSTKYQKGQHQPYLCCAKGAGENDVRTYYGRHCGQHLLKDICSEYGDAYDEIVLIAHNCGYDYRFLKKLKVINLKLFESFSHQQ